MHFEHRREPILPWSQFMWRLAGSVAVGALLVAISLGMGMIGYRQLMRL